MFVSCEAYEIVSNITFEYLVCNVCISWCVYNLWYHAAEIIMLKAGHRSWMKDKRIPQISFIRIYPML